MVAAVVVVVVVVVIYSTITLRLYELRQSRGMDPTSIGGSPPPRLVGRTIRARSVDDRVTWWRSRRSHP